MTAPDRFVADPRDRDYLIFERFIEAGEQASAQDALWLHYPQPEEHFADPAVHSWLATDQEVDQIRGPWRSWSLNRLALHPDLLDLAERFLGPTDLRLNTIYYHPRSVRSINTSSRARRARRPRVRIAEPGGAECSGETGPGTRLQLDRLASIALGMLVPRRAPPAALRPSGPRRRRRGPLPGNSLGHCSAMNRPANCGSGQAPSRRIES